jgi:tagaturonate reductase
MQLSNDYINTQTPDVAEVFKRIQALPEKVLQFGTGVLLRGLPDYYIDQANKKGIFNGRIVIVKSTDSGSTDNFTKQDHLYTHCIRGFENGNLVNENIINASISRVLNAKDQCKQILECTKNEELGVIISNTTEMGIQLVEESIFQDPPTSFPAKLLAFLYERFKYFGGSEESGMVIVPTELIPGNGDKLLSILLDLAGFNKLDRDFNKHNSDPNKPDNDFIQWIKKSNRFCNSLVDRIVPGKPSAEKLKAFSDELQYEDDLLIVSEPYSLWAIEGDHFVKQRLSFYKADDSVIIENDIEKYRELKLRLLNGTHTLSCAIALLMDFEFVHEFMQDELMKNFVERLMKEEIGKSIPAKLSEQEIITFSNQVIDRFKNPHINHKWISISSNYTSKMVLRNIPLLLEWYHRYDKVPQLMTLGFSAYLYFIRPKNKDDLYYGNFRDRTDKRDWEEAQELMIKILKEESVWGIDLNNLPGFTENVLNDLNLMRTEGMRSTLRYVMNLQAV